MNCGSSISPVHRMVTEIGEEASKLIPKHLGNLNISYRAAEETLADNARRQEPVAPPPPKKTNPTIFIRTWVQRYFWLKFPDHTYRYRRYHGILRSNRILASFGKTGHKGPTMWHNPPERVAQVTLSGDGTPPGSIAAPPEAVVIQPNSSDDWWNEETGCCPRRQSGVSPRWLLGSWRSGSRGRPRPVI
ncbi:Hypothetical protein SMAX5B_008041 [Scophthalmus maximus]|uniref:Uncharacterized protein n=1 Tax=Scophthalmus maximus TaxID=52904 RepID=A0A2U9BEJ8_SCOMX|nr:Hypothetical protein SMAX5B_008041 [Scophthalmus maximus]